MSKQKLGTDSGTWTTVQFCPVSLEKDGKNHAVFMESISLQGMKMRLCITVKGDSLHLGDRIVFEVKTPYGKSSKYNGRISMLKGTEEIKKIYVDFNNIMFKSNDPIISLIDSPF